MDETLSLGGGVMLLLADLIALDDMLIAALAGAIAGLGWRNAQYRKAPPTPRPPGLRLVEDCGEEWEDPPEPRGPSPAYTISSLPSRRVRWRALRERLCPLRR